MTSVDLHAHSEDAALIEAQMIWDRRSRVHKWRSYSVFNSSGQVLRYFYDSVETDRA